MAARTVLRAPLARSLFRAATPRKVVPAPRRATGSVVDDTRPPGTRETGTAEPTAPAVPNCEKVRFSGLDFLSRPPEGVGAPQQQSAPSSQDAGVGSAADAASASAKPSEPSGATGAGNGELGGIPVAPQPPPSVVQPASSDGKSEGGYLSDTMDELKPRELVAELDRYIVGQAAAKRCVAIAMRNRWRRHKLPSALASDVMPKNILMIGPTGVGKTEIARRLAKLINAPFIKVEATKFTEVGFHGRDVDMIIKDLVEVSINNTKTRRRRRLKPRIEAATEETLLRALLGANMDEVSKKSYREQLRSGALDNQTVEVDVASKDDFTSGAQNSIGGEMIFNLRRVLTGRRTERRKLTIREARPLVEELEMEKMVANEDVYKEAIRSVEQDGIVFIDEIDKICSRGSDRHGADASAEGVQRDLLPLIEGCTISTKYGNVDTDHILFVASGAFHAVKPSDMLAELQGRLPIRVELKGLTEDDLYRILTEPETNLIKQQQALLKTEGVELQFTDDAIRRIAHVAADVNNTVENIGARRLHTVIERIVEDVSFSAPEMAGQTVVIDVAKVNEKVTDFLLKTDLSKFIL